MRRSGLLPILAAACALLALALVTVAAAAADDGTGGEGDPMLNRQVTGRVTALTPTLLTVRPAGGTTLSCNYYNDANGAGTINFWQIQVGQQVTASCLSLDGGATWKLANALPVRGNQTSVTGTIMGLGSQIEIAPPHDPFRFSCHFPQGGGVKTGPLELGQSVALTCVFTGDHYELQSLTQTQAIKGHATITISGPVLDLTGDQLEVTRDGFGYAFTVPAALRAATTALSTYGTQVTVEGRASGKQWLLVRIDAT